MNGDNQGFNPTPIIMMGGGPGWRESDNYRPEREARVPPRVQVAMDLAKLLCSKGSVQFAHEFSNNQGMMDATGQQLEPEEMAALKKAMVTIGDYAAGTLKVSKLWDLPREMTKDEKKGEGGIGEFEYMKTACPACNQNKLPIEIKMLQRVQCDYCGGKGWMMLARVGD